MSKTDDIKKPEVTPEVREFFRGIGHIRGTQLKEKHGSQYFRDLAAKRKTHGRQKKKVEPEEGEGNGEKES